MDFTKKLETETGEVYTAPELFKNDEGINEERDIELDFFRVVGESLLKQLPFSPENEAFNTPEVLEKRFDLYVKIQDSKDGVDLNEDEKSLIIDLANIRFQGNVVIISRLLKALQ